MPPHFPLQFFFRSYWALKLTQKLKRQHKNKQTDTNDKHPSMNMCMRECEL